MISRLGARPSAPRSGLALTAYLGILFSSCGGGDGASPTCGATVNAAHPGSAAGAHRHLARGEWDSRPHLHR